MRKPRVVIFDDESLILGMLRDYFNMRGYEVLSYAEPTNVCPLYGKDGDVCSYFDPCADVILTDFNMPGLNGVELLEHQHRKGCPLDNRNKAVMSGLLEDQFRRRIEERGYQFLQKPFTIFKLSEWLSQCEQRMDLGRQLATRRQEERFDSFREVTFRVPTQDRTFTGVAVNISRSGLCLKVPMPLQREETLHIDAGHFSTCRQASVRWVQPADNGSYLAGLHCC
ncbi:MAG: response regulator [Nitrospirota bacterium]|nr:response regulator [Nitrospirota bacterium]